MQRNKQKSELLTLLNTRKSWELKLPYTHPAYGQQSRKMLEEAVRCMTALEGSDPFVEERVRHYLTQGYCVPSEVLKDCRSRTAQRAREAKGSPLDANALLQVKRLSEEKQRKKDADKAWNQFHHAQYIEDKAA